MLHDTCGTVGGAIVDDQHFGIPAALPDTGKHMLERSPESLFLVVGRDDDAYLGTAHRAELSLQRPWDGVVIEYSSVLSFGLLLDSAQTGGR